MTRVAPKAPILAAIKRVRYTRLTKGGHSLSTRYATIEVAKEVLNFSAAHFTIFNATDREDLHGHNFQVACEMTAELSEAGLMFDYSIVKRAIRALCDEIDEKVLLPEQSPHLAIRRGRLRQRCLMASGFHFCLEMS